MENKEKLENLTKVAKNFYLEAQKLLRIYDFRLKCMENKQNWQN